MVTLLYFARLRENLGMSSETVHLPDGTRDVGTLVQWLRQRGGNWAEELREGRQLRMAVNQVMADAGTAIADGDEIALFPPVTGG